MIRTVLVLALAPVLLLVIGVVRGPAVVAAVATAQESDLEKLARDVAYQQRRVPAAERTPGIQMLESRLDYELLTRYRKLTPQQAIELQQRVIALLDEPGLMKLVEGALISEDFEASYLDLYRWQQMAQDETIQVGNTDGVLEVKGKASGGVTLGPGFCGVVSRTFAQRDVELITRVCVMSEPPLQDCEFLTIVHLCGTQPDWFTHLECGRHRGDAIPTWSVVRRHLDPHAKIEPFQFPLGIGKWHTIKFRHEGATHKTNAWIEGPNGRVHVLKDQPVYLTTTKVELKTLATLAGAAVHSQFDDCRLYPSPLTTPLRILVIDVPGEGKPVPGVRLTMRVRGSSAPPVLGVTDVDGRVDLMLPGDVDYPGRVKLEGFIDGKSIYQQSSPEVVGVRGVYPGDTWVLTLGRSVGAAK